MSDSGMAEGSDQDDRDSSEDYHNHTRFHHLEPRPQGQWRTILHRVNKIASDSEPLGKNSWQRQQATEIADDTVIDDNSKVLKKIFFPKRRESSDANETQVLEEYHHKKLRLDQFKQSKVATDMVKTDKSKTAQRIGSAVYKQDCPKPELSKTESSRKRKIEEFESFTDTTKRSCINLHKPKSDALTTNSKKEESKTNLDNNRKLNIKKNMIGEHHFITRKEEKPILSERKKDNKRVSNETFKDKMKHKGKKTDIGKQKMPLRSKAGSSQLIYESYENKSVSAIEVDKKICTLSTRKIEEKKLLLENKNYEGTGINDENKMKYEQRKTGHRNGMESRHSKGSEINLRKIKRLNYQDISNGKFDINEKYKKRQVSTRKENCLSSNDAYQYPKEYEKKHELKIKLKVSDSVTKKENQVPSNERFKQYEIVKDDFKATKTNDCEKKKTAPTLLKDGKRQVNQPVVNKTLQVLLHNCMNNETKKTTSKQKTQNEEKNEIGRKDSIKENLEGLKSSKDVKTIKNIEHKNETNFNNSHGKTNQKQKESSNIKERSHKKVIKDKKINCDKKHTGGRSIKVRIDLERIDISSLSFLPIIRVHKKIKEKELLASNKMTDEQSNYSTKDALTAMTKTDTKSSHTEFTSKSNKRKFQTNSKDSFKVNNNKKRMIETHSEGTVLKSDANNNAPVSKHNSKIVKERTKETLSTCLKPKHNSRLKIAPLFPIDTKTRVGDPKIIASDAHLDVFSASLTCTVNNENGDGKSIGNDNLESNFDQNHESSSLDLLLLSKRIVTERDAGTPSTNQESRSDNAIENNFSKNYDNPENDEKVHQVNSEELNQCCVAISGETQPEGGKFDNTLSNPIDNNFLKTNLFKECTSPNETIKNPSSSTQIVTDVTEKLTSIEINLNSIKNKLCDNENNILNPKCQEKKQTENGLLTHSSCFEESSQEMGMIKNLEAIGNRTVNNQESRSDNAIENHFSKNDYNPENDEKVHQVNSKELNQHCVAIAGETQPKGGKFDNTLSNPIDNNFLKSNLIQECTSPNETIKHPPSSTQIVTDVTEKLTTIEINLNSIKNKRCDNENNILNPKCQEKKQTENGLITHSGCFEESTQEICMIKNMEAVGNWTASFDQESRCDNTPENHILTGTEIPRDNEKVPHVNSEELNSHRAESVNYNKTEDDKIDKTSSNPIDNHFLESTLIERCKSLSETVKNPPLSTVMIPMFLDLNKEQNTFEINQNSTKNKLCLYEINDPKTEDREKHEEHIRPPEHSYCLEEITQKINSNESKKVRENVTTSIDQELKCDNTLETHLLRYADISEDEKILQVRPENPNQYCGESKLKIKPELDKLDSTSIFVGKCVPKFFLIKECRIPKELVENPNIIKPIVGDLSEQQFTLQNEVNLTKEERSSYSYDNYRHIHSDHKERQQSNLRYSESVENVVCFAESIQEEIKKKTNSNPDINQESRFDVSQNYFATVIDISQDRKKVLLVNSEELNQFCYDQSNEDKPDTVLPKSVGNKFTKTKFTNKYDYSGEKSKNPHLSTSLSPKVVIDLTAEETVGIEMNVCKEEESTNDNNTTLTKDLLKYTKAGKYLASSTNEVQETEKNEARVTENFNGRLNPSGSKKTRLFSLLLTKKDIKIFQEMFFKSHDKIFDTTGTQVCKEIAYSMAIVLMRQNSEYSKKTFKPGQETDQTMYNKWNRLLGLFYHKVQKRIINIAGTEDEENLLITAWFIKMYMLVIMECDKFITLHTVKMLIMNLFTTEMIDMIPLINVSPCEFQTECNEVLKMFFTYLFQTKKQRVEQLKNGSLSEELFELQRRELEIIQMCLIKYKPAMNYPISAFLTHVKHREEKSRVDIDVIPEPSQNRGVPLQIVPSGNFNLKTTHVHKHNQLVDHPKVLLPHDSQESATNNSKESNRS